MKLRTALEIEYPESDGRPFGESDLHRDWMIRIIELLRQRYRGQRVYVSGNLLLYYEQGDPSHFVVPDAMVIKDCDPGRRRIFKVWEEKRVPNVVFETTSRSTKREDSSYKTLLYQQLSIPEYFLYDPTTAENARSARQERVISVFTEADKNVCPTSRRACRILASCSWGSLP